MDFVKGGVQRMMIARPDALKSKVLYKHPDQNFPFWSQLTVDSDEVVLFFKNGFYVGTLGPQREPYTLTTQNIPFLGSLVDQFTGGNAFISELYFVTMRPMYNEGFGDQIGSMRDPDLELRVTVRANGTYSFRVIDPYKFLVGFVGQGGDPDRAMQWVKDLLFMGLKSTVGELIKSREYTLLDLGQMGPEVARRIVQNCPDLANCGVQVLEIGKLNINVSEEDQRRLDEKQDVIASAKVEAMAAQRGVAKAQAEAQAKQFALDQEFQQRARYVNQLDMQRYGQFAQAEATMGLGQGLAQGGDGVGAAAMAQGMALGAGLGYGQRRGRPRLSARWLSAARLSATRLSAARLPAGWLPATRLRRTRSRAAARLRCTAARLWRTAARLWRTAARLRPTTCCSRRLRTAARFRGRRTARRRSSRRRRTWLALSELRSGESAASAVL